MSRLELLPRDPASDDTCYGQDRTIDLLLSRVVRRTVVVICRRDPSAFGPVLSAMLPLACFESNEHEAANTQDVKSNFPSIVV
jgi:hypothetical protein